MEWLFPICIVCLLWLAFNKKACMLMAHLLNNLFNLPHPGPNDIQGTCWCRRHEGKDKYTFADYLSSRFKK